MLALHAIALGTMSHGLCVLDEEGRLVLFNQRFLEIMQLAPDTVGVGTSFRAVLELAVARGQLTRKALNETWRECRDKLAQAEPFVLRHRFAGDAVVAVNFRRSSPGAGS